MNKRLVKNGWHDEYESLIYFQILDQNNKAVWTSLYYDIREFSEDPDLIKELRQDVDEACQHHMINCETSSDDYYDWKSL